MPAAWSARSGHIRRSGGRGDSSARRSARRSRGRDPAMRGSRRSASRPANCADRASSTPGTCLVDASEQVLLLNGVRMQMRDVRRRDRDSYAVPCRDLGEVRVDLDVVPGHLAGPDRLQGGRGERMDRVERTAIAGVPGLRRVERAERSQQRAGGIGMRRAVGRHVLDRGDPFGAGRGARGEHGGVDRARRSVLGPSAEGGPPSAPTRPGLGNGAA